MANANQQSASLAALTGTTTATIALGADEVLSSLVLPASLGSTSATFQVSVDNSTFVTLKAVGGASNYSVTVAASSCVPLDSAVFAGHRFIKVVFGTSETAKVVSYVWRKLY